YTRAEQSAAAAPPRHRPKAVMTKIVDRLDVNHVADLHHILRPRRRRAHRRAPLVLGPGPLHLLARHRRLASVVEADMNRTVRRVSEHDGNAPCGNAGM